MMPSSSTTSKTQVASTTSDTTNTSDNTSFDGHLTSARDREVVPAQRRSCKSENHRGVERDNGCNSFLATKVCFVLCGFILARSSFEASSLFLSSSSSSFVYVVYRGHNGGA